MRPLHIQLSPLLIYLFSNAVEFCAAVQNVHKSVVVDSDGSVGNIVSSAAVVDSDGSVGNIAYSASLQSLHKSTFGQVLPKGTFAFESSTETSEKQPSRLIRTARGPNALHYHAHQKLVDLRNAQDARFGHSFDIHAAEYQFVHTVEMTTQAPNLAGATAVTTPAVVLTTVPAMPTTPPVASNAAPTQIPANAVPAGAPVAKADTATEASKEDNSGTYVGIVVCVLILTSVWVGIVYAMRNFTLWNPVELGNDEFADGGLVRTMSSQDFKGRYVRRSDSSSFALPGSESKAEAMRDRIIRDAQAGDRSRSGAHPKLQNIDVIQPKWSSTSVAAVLAQLGEKAREWEHAALEDLAREMSKGKARFCRRYESVWRVVDIVVVIVVYDEEKLVIQETAHPEYRRKYQVDDNAQAKFDSWAEQAGGAGGFQAGGAGKILEKTVKGRLLSGESVMDCARRCLIEKLGSEIVNMIQVKPDLLEAKETADFFDGMPGLGSLTRQFIIEARVNPAGKDDIETLGIPERTLSVGGYTYSWMKIDEVQHVRKHFRQKGPAISKGLSDIDNSLVPVMAWSEAEVASLTEKYGVNSTVEFGMTTGELYRALQNGEVSVGLAGGSSNDAGRLVCIDETITLIPEETVLPSALPSTRKWSNEDVSMATLRLAQLDSKFAIGTGGFGTKSPSGSARLKLDGKVVSTIDTDGTLDRFVYREIIVLGPKLRDR